MLFKERRGKVRKGRAGLALAPSVQPEPQQPRSGTPARVPHASRARAIAVRTLARGLQRHHVAGVIAGNTRLPRVRSNARKRKESEKGQVDGIVLLFCCHFRNRDELRSPFRFQALQEKEEQAAGVHLGLIRKLSRIGVPTFQRLSQNEIQFRYLIRRHNTQVLSVEP